ncbi:unnamed protein product [Malus baccata var. baccata]
MEDSDTTGIMEELSQTLGDKLHLTDRENEGVVIGRKDVEGALLGFQYILLAEVLTERTVNAEVFSLRCGGGGWGFYPRFRGPTFPD